MAGLIPFNNPFNRKNTGLARTNTDTDFEDFYNLLDDFFNDGLTSSRSLLTDTFKIDIEEKENEYLIEAELPGVKKKDVSLDVDGDTLCISVNHTEEINKDGEKGKNYIHRERRASSVSRRVRLADAKLGEIKAKLDDGVLTVTVPKDVKTITSRKINIE